MKYFISANPDRLDVGAITDWLHSTWGHWQSPEQMRVALSNSIVLGVYEAAQPQDWVTLAGVPKDIQLGFLRIVSDHATFSALTDVYVSAPYRGRGLGRMLMEAACELLELKNCITILSAREEVRGFYEKFGFRWLGGVVMQRDPK